MYNIATSLDNWQISFTDDWNILCNEEFYLDGTPCGHCYNIRYDQDENTHYCTLPVALVVGYEDDGHKCGKYMCLDCVLEDAQELDK